MFKLKVYNLKLPYIMSLSKKDIDKLNSYIRKNNSSSNISDIKQITNKKPEKSNNPSDVDDPNRIFYSIIDNSNSLYETSQTNKALKRSEETFFNRSNNENNPSQDLSVEEELYDEFNYLLDE